MHKSESLPAAFYRFVLLSLSILCLLSAGQFRQVIVEKGILSTSIFWNGFTIFLFVLGLALAVLDLVSLIRPSALKSLCSIEKKLFTISRSSSIIFTVIFALLYSVFFLIDPILYDFFGNLFPHALLLFFFSLIILAFLHGKSLGFEREHNNIFVWILIPLGIVFLEGLSAELSYVSHMPFASSWSEASHMYYASTMFARRIYGFPVSMSPYGQSRYWLQGLPFMFPAAGIWVHRLWQLLLSNGMPLLFVFLLVKRLAIKERLTAWLLVLFGIVWLSQIYVYYNLIAGAILVLIFYSRENWKRNLLVILIASVWEGFSKVNWIPVPGLLAVFLFLLETKFDRKAGILSYIKRPSLYFFLGTAAGLLAQYCYFLISGIRDLTTVTTIFRSFFLPERLFPNATFAPGILPGILLLSGVMLIFIFRNWFLDPGFSWQRRFGVFIILAVFFIGGLLASIKVGGGNNLHNLDAFAMFLLILVLYGFTNRQVPDIIAGKPTFSMPPWLMLLILLTPLVWSLFFPVQPRSLKYDLKEAKDAIQIINQTIDQYAPNRKVLFISQRQLLFFGNVKNVPLIPEFEQEILIDIMMASDRPRLDEFLVKLRRHEFEMIVVSPLNEIKLGPEETFALENNLWVEGVSSQILLLYKPVVTLPEFGLELLIPKT